MSDYQQKQGARKPKGKKPDAQPDEGPINAEAERIVLASILADNRVYEEYADRISAEDFHDGLHRQIFTASGRLIARGKRAEPASIMSELTETAPMADMTTANYLDKLKFNARKAADVAAFVDAVKNAAVGRRIRVMCAQYDGLAKTGAEGLVDKMSQDLTAISGNDAPDTACHVSARIGIVMEKLRARKAAGGGISGLSTGFPQLDYMIDGIGKSKLYVIGARPKQGKTALGLCIMRNMLKVGQTIKFFSLEMPKDEVIQRMIALEADVDYTRMSRGEYNEDEELRIEDAAETVDRWPWHIDDAGGLTIEAIALRARHAVSVDNCVAIFVDYMQCIKGPGRGRYEQITEVSQGLAAMRKTLNVPIVALAQLNRKMVDRSSVTDFSKIRAEMTRPNDGDLRDSGQIEQDGDAVIFLNRPEVYIDALKPDPGDIDKTVDWQAAMTKFRGKAEVIVHFNRSGPRGICNLHFDGPAMKFSTTAPNFGTR